MDFKEISLNAIVHRLVALIKYAVLIVIMVAAFKYWAARDVCKVDSEDMGMRPAIKSTSLLVFYDRTAWTEADLKRGDIVIALRPVGEDREKFPFRVVAVEGDWVENDPHGYIVVNGQVEHYKGLEADSIKPVSNYILPKSRVPRGYVLLLSDNRTNARATSPGLVPIWTVMGKAHL